MTTVIIKNSKVYSDVKYSNIAGMDVNNTDKKSILSVTRKMITNVPGAIKVARNAMLSQFYNKDTMGCDFAKGKYINLKGKGKPYKGKEVLGVAFAGATLHLTFIEEFIRNNDRLTGISYAYLEANEKSFHINQYFGIGDKPELTELQLAIITVDEVVVIHYYLNPENGETCCIKNIFNYDEPVVLGSGRVRLYEAKHSDVAGLIQQGTRALYTDVIDDPVDYIKHASEVDEYTGSDVVVIDVSV